MAQSTLSIRMDEELKKDFDTMCNNFGMNISTAITIFAKKVVAEKKIPFEISFNDDYDTEAFTRHFLDQCKTIISEREIELDLRITDPNVIKGNSHELRVITNLIIYEMILQAIKSVTIDLNKNRLTLSADAYRSAPPVWGIMKEVLKKRGISFSFDDKGCVLEFNI